MKKFFALLPLMLLAGCANPADNVPAASVGPASSQSSEAAPAEAGSETASGDPAATDDAAPGAASQAYAIDPAASKIEFIGSKVTGSHVGGFKQFSGTFRTAEGRLADDGIHVEIDMNSLWSDNDRLTGHLKNADFFDVPKYPTAVFSSTKVEPAGSGAVITGDLTLHGVTKSISFPAQVQASADKVHLTSEFSLNRFDFDVKYAGKSDDLIRKEVVIKLDVTATP